MELRRDKKLSMKFEDKKAKWTQYFLDDADSPMLVPAQLVSEASGKCSALQRRQRASAADAGLGYSADKAIEGQLVVERMGACVDGVVGRISVPEKTLTAYVFAIWVWACGGFTGKLGLCCWAASTEF